MSSLFFACYLNMGVVTINGKYYSYREMDSIKLTASVKNGDILLETCCVCLQLKNVFVQNVELL